jgi:uncharacterized small protein (DUF1192 family)
MNQKLRSTNTLNLKTNRNRLWAISLSVLATALLSTTTTSAQTPDTLMGVRDSSNNSMMSLHKNGALLVGGSYDGSTFSGGIPAEGAGTRMMWYPEKASFRAGYVTGTQWDDANIGYHSFAVGEGVRASGDNSVALGARCVAAGSSTFAVGEQNTATGAASVALGYHAHTNARQGSFVFADRSTPDTLRAGVNHSANWRVNGGFRIFTSSNLSTGVTLQSGTSVSNWGQSNAVISTSTGAYLSDAGVWTNTSDVNRKHLFENISGEDILMKIRGLSITRWSYRTDDDNIRHIGPMAQDFYATFKLGNDDKAIGTVDADGIALVGVKALEERTTKLASELQALKAENEKLRERLDGGVKSTPLTTAALPLLAVLGVVGLGGALLRRRKNVQNATGNNN